MQRVIPDVAADGPLVGPALRLRDPDRIGLAIDPQVGQFGGEFGQEAPRAAAQIQHRRGGREFLQQCGQRTIAFALRIVRRVPVAPFAGAGAEAEGFAQLSPHKDAHYTGNCSARLAGTNGVLIGLAFALFLALAPPAQAASCSNTAVGAFTCIQSAANNLASSATPSISTGSNVAATSVVVGKYVWVSGSITLNSLTLSGAGCSGASSAIYDNGSTLAGNWKSAAFALWGLSAGACTVQFNLSLAATSVVVLHELAGAVNNADPVGTRHAHNEQATVGTATDGVTSGSVTAAGTDYIFGAVVGCSEASTINSGTGYTGREGTNNAGAGCWVGSEDKSASGSNTATFTDTNANEYTLTNVLSVAAAAGASTPKRLMLLGVGTP